LFQAAGLPADDSGWYRAAALKVRLRAHQAGIHPPNPQLGVLKTKEFRPPENRAFFAADACEPFLPLETRSLPLRVRLFASVARTLFGRTLQASVLLLAGLHSPAVLAQAPRAHPEIETAAARGKLLMVIPIYSQLLKIMLPPTFIPASEKIQGPSYLWEAVPSGESVKKWSQMITVTGAKGLASLVTPEFAALKIAQGYRQTCPDSFRAQVIGKNALKNYRSFSVLVACGVALPTGEPYSEAMLLIVIQGENEIYSVQWAERLPGSKTPYEFDARWTQRLDKLANVRLCSVVPGETAPYPSCAD